MPISHSKSMGLPYYCSNIIILLLKWTYQDYRTYCSSVSAITSQGLTNSDIKLYTHVQNLLTPD